MLHFYKKRGWKTKKLCKYTKGSWLVHTMFINDWYYKDSSKELHKTDVVMFFITHKFFHNNRPGKPLPGHSSFISPYFGGFFYFTGYNIIDIRLLVYLIYLCKVRHYCIWLYDTYTHTPLLLILVISIISNFST